MSKAIPISAIALAAFCTIFFIVIAATPGYFHEKGDEKTSYGAFRYCVSPEFVAKQIQSIPQIPNQSGFPQFPNFPQNLQINGNGARRLLQMPDFCQFQPSLCNGAGSGNSNSNSNSNSNGGSSYRDIFIATCMRGGQSRQLCEAVCNDNAQCRQQGQGQGQAQSICGAIDLTTMCTGAECEKIQAVRAFLILGLLTATATTGLTIFHLIASPADMFYYVGAGLASASSICSLLCMSIVASNISDAKATPYYGFGFQIILIIFMAIDAGLIIMSAKHKGTKVLTTTSQHNHQNNENNGNKL